MITVDAYAGAIQLDEPFAPTSPEPGIGGVRDVIDGVLPVRDDAGRPDHGVGVHSLPPPVVE